MSVLSKILREIKEVHGLSNQIRQKQLVLALRHTLEDELTIVLRRYGIFTDRIQDMVDVSFKFYKLLTKDPAFADFFQELMFSRYLREAQAKMAA